MGADPNIYLKRFSHFFEFRLRLPPGAKKGGERGWRMGPHEPHPHLQIKVHSTQLLITDVWKLHFTKSACNTHCGDLLMALTFHFFK